MAKTYKILVNDGKGTDIQPVRVVQGASANGDPVRVLAKRGWRFELQDDIKGKSVAPDQVRIKRVGKSLTLMFDGSQRADAVIEDFYADNTDADKDNGMPKLVGTAENGGMYEYVPQDPAVSSMPAELKDGNTPVIMALGGGPLEGDFVLAGLPLVAAAGGISGWAVGGAALGAAALAGGGGGGGGGAAVVVPSKATGLLTHDPERLNDTGFSNQDSITKNQNPTYSGVADKGATVEVTVNRVVYTTTASTKDGSYSIPLLNEGKPLDDGVYTPSIKVSNPTGGTITSDGAPFTIDHTTDKNQDATKSPTTVVDDNSVVPVAIVSIDSDTGSAATDFITSDGSLTFSGTATGFKTNGDVVHVQVVKADGSVVLNQYVTPDSQGVWSINNQTQTLAIGDYTIKANIEDLAGNVVKAAADQPLTIAYANVLVARVDTETVIENLTVKSDVKTGVLANDGDTTAQVISVINVGLTTASDAVAQDKTTKTTITGLHGQLDMFSDGHYEYRETDDSLPAGVHMTDSFAYEVLASGTNRTKITTLSIDITGVNDPGTVVLKNTQSNWNAVTPDTISTSKGIVVADLDTGESALFGVFNNGQTSIAGTFGNLQLTRSAESGVYDWIYAKNTTNSNSAQITQHDLFALVSLDETASQALDFQVSNGSIGAGTMQEFYVTGNSSHITKGLKVKGTDSTIDTLILKSIDSATFDLTGTTTSLESIEKIQLGGTGSKVLKLNLANLMQLDTNNTVATKLFIDGDQSTTVVFNNGTGAHAKSGDFTLDNSHVYSVYTFGNDELLVQTTITNITVTG